MTDRRKPETVLSERPRIVLGIDPGFAHVGMATVERPRVGGGNFACLGVVSLDVSELPDEFRVGSFVSAMLGCLDDAIGEGFAIDAVAYEHQEQSQVAQAKAGRFNLAAGRTNRVVGAIEAVASIRNLPTIALSPATWKKRIGAGGRADKAAVSRAVAMLLPGMPRTSQHARDAAGIGMGALIGWRADGVRSGKVEK